MKYTAALLALAAAVFAQDISTFPECSLECIINGISSGTSCELTDFACVCENTDSLVEEATPCVLGACGAEVALNEVLPAVEQFCAGVGGGDDGGDNGGDDDGDDAGDDAGDDDGGDDDEPSVTVTFPAPEPTEGPAEEDTDDEDSEPSPTDTFGSYITPGPTGNATVPPAPEETTPPPVTAGAAAMGYMGSLGMLALGAVAAL